MMGRRKFILGTSSAAAATQVAAQVAQGPAGSALMTPNMLGAYGNWAAQSVADPPRLSFRQPEFKNVDSWRAIARARFRERLAGPAPSPRPIPILQQKLEFDGLDIEQLQWQLPYGPPTDALLLRPKGVKGKLPGIVGLHDHSGLKYFGLRKITKMSKDTHPMILRHQELYYGGLAWANELARRGYAVLVHDTFAFGSRRIRLADVPAHIRDNQVEVHPEAEDEIQRYNQFARAHEHLVAKSLFCAGMTWPGVFVNDDQRALDYLCSRPDVDATRVGCAGLSSGGLRTVMLTGADDRIRCACAVGQMTTWRDYMLNKCWTHTWMCYVPGLSTELDYPEILGLAVPSPVLVLNNKQDALFTLSEMERADRMLADVYKKAGAPEHYRGTFYDGPHKFDREMQKEAFAWFDRWLKA